MEISGLPQVIPSKADTDAPHMKRLPTFNEYVSALHLVLHTALRDFTFPPQVGTFQNKAVAAEGQVVLASNGSLQGQHDATKGWKLFCRQDGTSAWGHRVVTSGGTTMSSLHLEIRGLLGGLVAVDTLLSTTTLGEGTIPIQSLKVYLDTKSSHIMNPKMEEQRTLSNSYS